MVYICFINIRMISDDDNFCYQIDWLTTQRKKEALIYTHLYPLLLYWCNSTSNLFVVDSQFYQFSIFSFQYFVYVFYMSTINLFPPYLYMWNYVHLSIDPLCILCLIFLSCFFPFFPFFYCFSEFLLAKNTIPVRKTALPDLW